jgi:hypothetical protein
VVRSQLTPVIYGGDVVAGDPLTADAEVVLFRPLRVSSISALRSMTVPKTISVLWIAPGKLPAA